MYNDLVLSEAGLRQVTCIIRERQLRLYGHMARLPAEYHAHQILSCRDPRGRPHTSWLRQVESYLKDMGKMGLASAWAMARRPKEYRRKKAAATRCSSVCPHTRPDCRGNEEWIPKLTLTSLHSRESEKAGNISSYFCKCCCALRRSTHRWQSRALKKYSRAP